MVNKSKKQKAKIFILCWLAYAIAYLCRNNLSIALPLIQSTLNLSSSQLGILGSLFFWVYGIGQLINGNIGDKLPTTPFISIGLLGSGIFNLLFGFTDNIIIMCVIWGLNGYFLSMLWGPIMKLLSNVFSGKVRSQVATGISTSMVAGFLLAWGMIGFVLIYFKWNWAFYLPGIIMITFAIVFYILMGKLLTNSMETDEIITSSKTNYTFIEIFKKSKMHYIVIACLAQGMVKDGISLWAPTFVMQSHNLELNSAISYIIIIPFMNLFGMLIANRLNKKFYHKEKMTAIIMFIFAIVFLTALVLFGHISPAMTILFLGLSSAMMYGCNTVLLGVIPLSFKKYDRTSSVAGFLDFCSYMAAGISSVITGFLIISGNWTTILIFWAIVSMIACVALAFSLNSDKHHVDKYQPKNEGV